MDNSLNKNWWDENTMSYQEWNLNEELRSKDDPKNIETVNKNYITSNPYLTDFFGDLEIKKSDNEISFEKVLDLGCGWGSSSILLSKLFKEVHSIDISTTSIIKAKKNIDLHKVKNIKLEELDAEKLSSKNEYDFVYSWGVIHHSSNPNKVYKKMYDSLKSDGAFMIMVYNKNSLRYYFKGIYQLLIKLKIFKGYNLNTVQKFFTDGYYHKHYNPKKLINELKIIGFNNLSYELTHMDKSYIPFFKKNSEYDNFLKKKFGWLLVIKGRK